MFIKVQPLNGLKLPLTYRIDSSDTIIDQSSLLGAIVKVPLQSRAIHALVVECGDHLGKNIRFTIKPIIHMEQLPHDPYYQHFIQTLANYYQLDITKILGRLQLFLSPHQEPDHNILTPTTLAKSITLTPEQSTIVTALTPYLEKPSYQPALIHGVTGSGKTEIYKKLITQTIEYQHSVIVMLPEVSLALQFEHIFKQTLASTTTIFGFHSATSSKEKTALWQALLTQQPLVIIGVHQPVLLPISNLGLIIVDEEHEPGYQEKKHPKINSKEAALLRAQQYQIPIILGSATPSVTSLYNVHKRHWLFFTLTKRYQGDFPAIKLVYLTHKQKRRNFWISNELDLAIANRLAKKEQIILFLNRRGFSFCVQCKNCGKPFTCPRCTVSFTLHNNDLLECHYCGIRKKIPPACSSCQHKEFLKKGIGTQQAVQIIQTLYPTARIARADMDSTKKKRVWQKTIQQFNTGNIDILIGTQTITKGYHFPNVTLVGILWADLQLNMPVFNAAEKTLQLLIQVAGRAGREQKNSQVIVQAMAQHHIFEYLNELSYRDFCTKEYELRALLSYPPHGRFAEIELTHLHESTVNQEALLLTQYLNKLGIARLTILGPATPPVAKIKSIFRRKIYLKAPGIITILDAYARLKKIPIKSTLHFNPSA